MIGGYRFQDLLRVQEHYKVEDERFYEMVTKLLWKDDKIEKGFLEYEELYETVKNFIERKKEEYNIPKKTNIKLPDYIRIIK